MILITLIKACKYYDISIRPECLFGMLWTGSVPRMMYNIFLTIEHDTYTGNINWSVFLYQFVYCIRNTKNLISNADNMDYVCILCGIICPHQYACGSDGCFAYHYKNKLTFKLTSNTGNFSNNISFNLFLYRIAGCGLYLDVADPVFSPLISVVNVRLNVYCVSI